MSNSKKIERIEVDSSMVDAVGYDEEKQILYAEFSNTRHIYAYYEVAKETFESLLEADSIGRFMRNNIIDCYQDVQINRKRFKW